MSDPVIDGSELLSMGLSMIIVIAAVIALGWLYSRFRFKDNAGGDIINVIASRGLGPKERLLLVQVGDQQLLVGITASQVRTLHTFDKPFAAAQVADESGGFVAKLRMAVRGNLK